MPFSLSNFMAGAGKGAADVGQTMVDTAIKKKAELDLLSVREQSENVREARRQAIEVEQRGLDRAQNQGQFDTNLSYNKTKDEADRTFKEKAHKDNLAIQQAELANKGLSVHPNADGQLGILNPVTGAFTLAKDAQGNPVTGQKDLSATVKAKLDLNTKMIEANLKAAADQYGPERDALLAEAKRLEAESNALIGLGASPGRQSGALDLSQFDKSKKPAPATQPDKSADIPVSAAGSARDAFGGDKGGGEYMRSAGALKQQFDADLATLPDKDLESKYITSGLYKRLSADRQSRLFKKTESLRLVRG